MSTYIIERVLDEGKYIIRTNNTIREMTKIFNVSKSTIHKDLHERLLYIDYELYKSVKQILNQHSSIRHIKGGEQTRKKYLKTMKTSNNLCYNKM